MKQVFLSVLLMVVPMVSGAVEINGIYYALNPDNKTAEVISAPGYYTGDVDIPELVSYETYSYNVTSIGKFAFNDCYDLTSVVIPNSVESIGEHAFYCCTSLVSVYIGNGVSFIDNGAFSGCDILENVYISDLEKWCSIVFVDDIGWYDGTNPLSIAKHLYLNGEEIKDLIIPNTITSICNGAFFRFSGFNSVTIPNSVTSIGNGAFFGNENLVNLTIPNSVTTIGSEAFRSCYGITALTIGNNVKYIDNSAFSECIGLTSVVIPNSVEYIGRCAFATMNLKEVFCYAENLPETDSDAFYSYDKSIFNGILHVPAGSIETYKTTDPWKNFKTIVPICDANGDGIIDAADIVEAVNYIMGHPSDKFNENSADANGDGTIDAADVVKLVNIIMDKQ